MTTGLLVTRENLVLLSLILLKLKCHLSKVTLHQQPSRKIRRTIERGRGGGSVRRGEGRRSENEKSMTERKESETSTRGGTTQRTDLSATAKTSRGGGMTLILSDKFSAPV